MTKLIVNENPKSPISEAYRAIRTNIQFTSIDKDVRIITATSAMAGEGKTTTISNLAVAFAQTGKSVIIIDADLRKPALHKMFSVPNLRGLTNALLTDGSLDEFINETQVENLSIMSAGPVPPNPSELLMSKRMKQLIETLSSHYDYVFVDAPPVAIVTDAAIVANLCDGVFIVTAAGKTDAHHVAYAKKLLENAKTNILGVILNKLEIDKNGNSKYNHYNYYQQYGETETVKKKWYQWFKK